MSGTLIVLRQACPEPAEVAQDERQPTTRQDKVRSAMQVVVSLIVLVVCLSILTAPNWVFANEMTESTQKWAAGWVGAVLGYWL